MNAVTLLAALRNRGINLSVDAGELRFRAPRGALSAELRGLVKMRKAELIALILAESTPALDTPPPFTKGQTPSTAEASLPQASEIHAGDLVYRFDCCGDPLRKPLAMVRRIFAGAIDGGLWAELADDESISLANLRLARECQPLADTQPRREREVS